MEKHWFVFYTKSRQEKKVRDLLLKAGYEAYLPLQSVMRQWTDRKKRVEVPLFNSYIFVRDFEHRIPAIVTIPGIAWNIRYNGKPAVLRDEDMALIRRFITTGLFIETASYQPEEMQAGDETEILDGPLAGTKGVLTGDRNHGKFTVLIEGINQVMRVEMPAYLLKKAKNADF